MSLFKRKLRSVSSNPEQAIRELLNAAISMQDDLEQTYQTIEKKLRALDAAQKELEQALAALTSGAAQP